jgi:hypothetical protein
LRWRRRRFGHDVHHLDDVDYLYDRDDVDHIDNLYHVDYFNDVHHVDNFVNGRYFAGECGVLHRSWIEFN